MLIALMVLGVALVAFGALVLMKYSDRPGGTIKWLGAEVSSKGAGLPLIALGVGCIAFGAVRVPRDSGGTLAAGDTTLTKSAATTSATLLGAGSSDTSCVAAVLNGIPRDRIDTLEAGMKDVEILGSHEKLDTPFALVLTEDGQRIGALRLRRHGGSSAPATLFKVEQAIDANCATVEDMSNISRGGNPRELMNWDTLRQRLGQHRYDLRIGGEAGVTVVFTRIP